MNEQIEAEEALLSRFISTYSAARERSARYWRQWMNTLGPLPRQVVEGLAVELAESAQITLAEAQAQLAAEKVASDMGVEWVRTWLTENDTRQKERERLSRRPLQPLTIKSTIKRKKK
jgi:hypothetical protein